MAGNDSTGTPRGIDVATLGFVREIRKIMELAACATSIDLNEAGTRFRIIIDVAQDKRPKIGALPLMWDVPSAVASLLDGRIEKLVFPDTSYEGARVAYWATPGDLIAAGLAPAAHLKRSANRWTKGRWSDNASWRAYFAPSGYVLYYTEELRNPILLERSRRDAAVREAIDRGEDLGVIRQDEDIFTTWIGTKADLIAARVCGEDHFPVAPKRKVYGSADGRENVESWCTEAMRRGYFEHVVHWDRETHDQRREQRIAQEPIAREETTVEAFADRCELTLMGLAEFVLETVSGKYHTARYERETIEKVSAAFEHARQILQASTPSGTGAVAPADSRAAVAKADPAFARFMADALTPLTPTRGRARR